MFTVLTLTGWVFAIGGLVMYLFPPKKINCLYGYRTSSSMKNQERWDFSQRYSAKVMMQHGIVLAIIGIDSFWLVPQANYWNFIAIGLIFAAVGLLIFRVERGIKQRFQATI